MKIALLTILILIVVALFSGLFFLMKEDGHSQKALRSLIIRVALSLLLIFLLVFSFYMGWIVPHPV